MTDHQAFENIVRELKQELGTDPDDEDLSLARRLFDSGVSWGMSHVSAERNKVSVHGTDGCMNCETGRITIYAGSRYCVRCQREKGNP